MTFVGTHSFSPLQCPLVFRFQQRFHFFRKDTSDLYKKYIPLFTSTNVLFFCSRIQFRVPPVFGRHASLMSFGLYSFSVFLYFSRVLQLWGVLANYFVECPSIGLSDAIFMTRLRLWVLGRRPQRWSAFLITSYQGSMPSTWLITSECYPCSLG